MAKAPTETNRLEDLASTAACRATIAIELFVSLRRHDGTLSNSSCNLLAFALKDSGEAASILEHAAKAVEGDHA